MANALVLETLSLKELGALGSSVRLKYWQHLRKGDLLDRLSALNRVFTQEDLDAATVALARKQAARSARIKGLQDVSPQNLFNASSDDSTSAQTSSLDETTRTSTSEPCNSDESVENKEQITETTVQLRSAELENDDSTVSGSTKSGEKSEQKVQSKSDKPNRRSEAPEVSKSSVAEPVQESAQTERPLSRLEESAPENVSALASSSPLNAKNIARITEQVVPMLAERLAKRLAECLAKELAFEDDSKSQDGLTVPAGEKNAVEISGDSNVADVVEVASKLVDKIVPPSPAVPSLETQVRKSGEEALKRETNSDRSTVLKEASTSDDALIETESSPSTSFRNASNNPSSDKKPEQTTSLKDKLRLKKFIGSPDDKADRLVLLVCDPYWIRACWEVTTQLVERVRSAMARHWHTADPILRLYRIDPTTARREFVKDVEISGGVSNWYVPVENPPSSFAVELGYKSRDGQFFTLLSSNAVQTPKQFVRDSNGRPCSDSFNAPFGFQANSNDRWIQKSRQPQVERLSSVEEGSVKTFSPSESAVGTSLSTGEGFVAPSTFLFQADAEVLFTGRVSNGATVKVRDEPVCQAPDGSFSIRFSLPERRHVFPIVATSLDENETQTIIVAIERNTKTLDPVYKEDEEE